MFNAFYFLEDLQGAHEVNFKKMYDEFNTKYFEDKLPKDLPIELKSMKGIGGAAWRELERSTGTQRPTKIQITTRFKRDPLDFAKILLHEMIHIWFYALYPNTRDYKRVFAGADGGHNHVFMKKLEDISKASGIEVPRRDELENVELLKKVTKPFHYLLIDKGQFRGIIVAAESVMPCIERTLAAYFFLRDKSIGMYYGTSKNEKLANYTMKRTCKNISSYVLKDEDFDMFMKDAKKLDIEKIVNDEIKKDD